MSEFRKETDSLGKVDVPADERWGAQTQRSLEHFRISKDLTAVTPISSAKEDYSLAVQTR